MSAVFTLDGTQWEHCRLCLGSGDEYSPLGRWVAIDALCYWRPTEGFPNGVDVCKDCARTLAREGCDIDFAPEPITLRFGDVRMGG